MFCVIWEFRVARDKRESFERMYGREGPWARLFRENAAFLGTDLYQSVERPGWYLTVDRWESRADYERFRREREETYRTIDALGEQLTEEERLVGEFKTGE
jgi:heme-degrading monooxygenase HmoA